MRVVSNDSKVLSVVNRRRGEKGYRLLQGDNLRSLFLSLTQQMVSEQGQYHREVKVSCCACNHFSVYANKSLGHCNMF